MHYTENSCSGAQSERSKWSLFSHSLSKKEDDKDSKTDFIAQRVFGSLALGAVGDTLGFGSGHNPQFKGLITPWELCGNTAYIFSVLRERFEDNYRNIRFRNPKGKQEWVVSDDTILHFMQAQTIAKLFTKTKEPTSAQVVRAIAVEHVKTFREYNVELTNHRWFGNSTRKTCRLFEQDPTHWNKYISYNPNATGCGGSMRGMIFGWIHSGEGNRPELIATSLNAGFLTNPSLTGALGVVSSAALTAFSLEDIPVSEWISNVRSVFLQTKDYLSDLNVDSNDCPEKYKGLVKGCLKEEEWERVLDNWTFFFHKTTGGRDRIPGMDEFPMGSEQRDQFHSEIEEHVCGYKPKPNRLTIGSRGDTSVMLALHGFLFGIRTLLDFFPELSNEEINTKPSNLRTLFQTLSTSQQNIIVDKIVEFTVLHGGDNDSTGGIALSLYGSIFGIGGVERKHIDEIEIMPAVMKVAEKIGKHAVELVK